MSNQSFRFVHAADIHLDSPLRGLDRYDGAPVEAIRGSTRQAFTKLIDLCLNNNVNFLILAGDLHDGDWKDYNSGLFFARQISRLRAIDCKVYLVRGNHDAVSVISKALQWPDHVHLFKASKPETFLDENIGLAIHGQSFPQKAVFEDLTTHYPDPKAEYFNIGVLHTSLTGREGHENYAPCQAETLLNFGYQYWALGHVHKREIIATDPWIVFPGNLQGRHSKELGAKGATLVEVRHGVVNSVVTKPLDVVRWWHEFLPIAGAENEEHLYELTRRLLHNCARQSQGRMAAIRLTLNGSGDLHNSLIRDQERVKQQIRALSWELDNSEIWIEKIQLKTSANIDKQKLAERDDALGGLLRTLGELRENEDQFKKFCRQAFQELDGKIPPDIRDSSELFDLQSDTLSPEFITEVEDWLLPFLSGP